MNRLIFPLFFIFFIVSATAESAETSFITSGTARARAMSMASAYYSIEDDFSSGFYNPGAFKVNSTRSERPFRIFFNPVCAVIGLRDFSQNDFDLHKDNELTIEEGLYSLATILKGAVYTTPVFDIGIGLWEEVIPVDPKTGGDEIFSVDNLTREAFHSVFFNLKIASSVSIGVSGTLFNNRVDGKNNYKNGHTIGVLLNPNPKMKVGIGYNFFPKAFSDARFGIESIENETITSGISYYPDTKTVFSIDLRNLNREDKITSREIHTGIERKIMEKFALRAGYYRKKSTENDVLSFGVGMLPKREELSKYSTSSRNDTISYTVIFEEDGFKRHWHMFSLLFRY